MSKSPKKRADRSRTRSGRPAPPKRAVTRSVLFEFTNSDAHEVSLAGNFNGWRPESGKMIRSGTDKWIKRLHLAPGVYEYRLVVDGNWMPDPNADHAIMNALGERNSLVTVPEME